MYAQDTKNRAVTKLLNVEPTSYSVTKEPLLLLIESEEYYNHYDGEVYAAEIRITHQILSPRGLRDRVKHSFVASYRHNNTGGEIVLTAPLSGGRALFLDPSIIRGSRVGTYLMNRLVEWAKQWPNADVSPIQLLSYQAGDGEEFNTERRNKFYERFNIKFHYIDPTTKEEGSSIPMKAAALSQVDSWKKNISEIDTFDFVAGQLEQADSAMMELAKCAHSREFLATQLKWAEANPSRWFARALFNKFAGLFGLVATLLLVGTVGYRVLLEISQWFN